ncbi:hypothetical protein [Bacillus sp. 22-7]|uniref:hypothetical protein n=1 Tax=Bacillus sp. 22-7 TaxID=2709707 RepID=UPI0013D1B308|nr:hypothetical protein [Bacillus sp. 22-7]
MYPTKEKLIKHLSNKMTNQDIAKVYGINFQKIQQLIKNYELKPDELRKVDKQTVYCHLLGNEVVYVGSGFWYRCRRYTNRRNSEHRRLMEEGLVGYKIVAEFDTVQDARHYERVLIKKYKQMGQAKFNKQTS